MDNCISKKDRRRQSHPPPPNGLIVRLCKMFVGSTYSGMQPPVVEGMNDAYSISHVLSVRFRSTLEEFQLVDLTEKEDMCYLGNANHSSEYNISLITLKANLKLTKGGGGGQHPSGKGGPSGNIKCVYHI